jgi:hypothetical protein
MTLACFTDLVHLNTNRIADRLATGIKHFVGLEQKYLDENPKKVGNDG